jgi:hypothetical protein
MNATGAAATCFYCNVDGGNFHGELAIDGRTGARMVLV